MSREFDQTLIARVRTPANRGCEGLTVAQIAEQRGRDPFETVFDLLVEEEGNVAAIFFSMDEADVRRVLSHPRAMIGSDGTAVAPEGPLSDGKPHPRFYGTFPRVLGHYARDLGLLPLPQAIRKMTGGSAAALGLRERGLLRDGYSADVTVFDPARVAERATYDDPHQYAAGIATVLVNGVVVIDAGEHTGALPGRVLRRGPHGVG